MLTPQEVSTHAFTKAMMGGYNMAAVDEFLDELTDDYTALYKENTTLKAKLKVLVEKVEEYRATEDSMRATLLTAQRMADSIVHEAEAKRDQMLREAESQAQGQITQYRRELEEAEDRLRQGREELARFVASGRELLNKELRFLEELPQAPVTAAVPPESAPPVEEIEEKVLAAFAAQTPESAGETAPETAEGPAPAEEAPADDYPEGDPFAREDLDATRRINLDELKFGRNYTGEE
jgi:cell division initiation protein